jgi:hypothetical protein
MEPELRLLRDSSFKGVLAEDTAAVYGEGCELAEIMNL